MHPLRLPLRRIAPPRPLRPPSYSSSVFQSRVFNSRAPLLVSRGGPRPQLSYLSPAFASRYAPLAIRALSTEQKQYIKYQLKLGAYWTVLGWIVLGGLAAGYFVLREDWLDRLYPSPEDWSWLAKHNWRKGRREEEEELLGKGLTDWGTVGSSFRTVYILCEEGSGFRAWANPLPRNANWDRSIPGVDADDIARAPISLLSDVSKIGCVISEKSEEWRRAYFHALMGMAKTAEMNVGWVRDKKRRILFPAEQMIGPSNPYPKPLWPGSPPAPLEEDCETAYDPPSLWYTRILTTDGFTRDQRLAAALAYASFTEFSGDKTTASELYDWSLNLASSSSDVVSDTLRAPLNLVNPTTGVLSSSAPYINANILAASTALASHHARTGSLSSALSIYLSVLRARRNSPSAPLNQLYPAKGPDLSLTSVDSLLHWIASLPFRSHMPPPPPSGDLPFQRTAASSCEDAAIMNYIGEILFASATGSGQRRDALSWTRDAVGIAEVGQADKKLEAKDKRICAQCLGTGLENWYRMVSVLAKEEEGDSNQKTGDSTPSNKNGNAGRSTWSFWAPFSSAADEKDVEGKVATMVTGPASGTLAEPHGEWRQEEAMVAKRRAEFAESKLMAQLNRHISTKSNWFVV